MGIMGSVHRRLESYFSVAVLEILAIVALQIGTFDAARIAVCSGGDLQGSIR